MSFLVTALKMKLGAFGWSEAIRRDRGTAGPRAAMSAEDGEQRCLVPLAVCCIVEALN